MEIKIRKALEEETKRRKLQAVDGKMDRSANTTDIYKMFTQCLAEYEEEQLEGKDE